MPQQPPSDDSRIHRRRSRVAVVALLGGQGLSGLGDMLAGIALPWFVLQETGSPGLTAVTGFASLVPLVIGGVIGGSVVDRFGFRPVSVAADVASGVTIAIIPVLALAGALEIWHVVLLAFLGSFLDIPGQTARQSVLPALADAAEIRLERLNAGAETMRRLTHLAGPPLAGVLIVLIGPPAVLWLDVASFAISVLLIIGLVPAIRPALDGDPEHWLERVREGFSFLVTAPLLRTLVLIIGAVNVLMNPIFLVVLPVYADGTTGGAVNLGLLIGAFGVGSVIAAVSFGAFAARVPRLAVIRGGLLATAVPVWVLSTIPAVPIAMAAMLVVGLAVGGIGPLILTVLGERTPSRLRGRVFGTYATLVNGAIPFGVLVTGVLLEAVPLGVAVGTIAALYSTVALMALVARPLSDLATTGATSAAET